MGLGRIKQRFPLIVPMIHLWKFIYHSFWHPHSGKHSHICNSCSAVKKLSLTSSIVSSRRSHTAFLYCTHVLPTNELQWSLLIIPSPFPFCSIWKMDVLVQTTGPQGHWLFSMTIWSFKRNVCAPWMTHCLKPTVDVPCSHGYVNMPLAA